MGRFALAAEKQRARRFVLFAVVSLLPIGLGCQRERVSSNASAVLVALCDEIESTAQAIPISAGSNDEDDDGGADTGDEHGNGNGNGPGQGQGQGQGQGNDEPGPGADAGNEAGCSPPAAHQRLKRLASESLPTRTRAARQILTHAPRFSDTVLLSASTISGDARDRKPRQWLARVVLERFDSCARQFSPAAKANSALALGRIAENPRTIEGHGDGTDPDESPASPEYVYWTLSAAACADELNVRHAGVRALGQLRDERARPLLEAIAAAPSTGDDVQDALLVVNANRALTTIFPTNSVSPEVVSEAKAGLSVFREALADAEVSP